MEGIKIMNNRKTGMARLMELTGTNKGLVISSVILASLAGIASFIPYIAIFYMVKEIVNIYPNFELLSQTYVLRYGLFALIGILSNIILYFVALMCSHFAAFSTLYQLKVDFASHLSNIPLGYHTIIGSGKLRKIMDENIEKIEGFIAHQLPDMVAAFISPIVMIIILLVVDWRFGIASILGILSGFLIQGIAGNNKERKKMLDGYQNSLEEMNNCAVEYVRGISVVKAFKQTVHSFSRFHKSIKTYTDIVIPYTLSFKNVMCSFSTVINNIYIFIIPVAIWIGMNTTDYKDFAVKFIFYMIFVPSIAGIMMKVLYVSKNTIQVTNGVERMDSILDINILKQSKKGKIPKKYDIEFKNVSFSYTKDTTALNQISFKAKQDEITAVVGPSGGGKSTIAHLIPRLFDINKGEILIGGIDIRQITNEELMKRISFVFQDVFLFKNSIMENIRMGDVKASDEDVIRAAKLAQCHEFIMNLPKGYNTLIGQEGVHLSGGEEQRIAIARAIVKDSPIVILDEATAFADPENEHLIQMAFKELLKDKTVIMIAHRLSTIKTAQHILVVDNGNIIEEGTHEELIKLHGKYEQMWNMYTSSLEWKIDGKVGA